MLWLLRKAQVFFLESLDYAKKQQGGDVFSYTTLARFFALYWHSYYGTRDTEFTVSGGLSTT